MWKCADNCISTTTDENNDCVCNCEPYTLLENNSCLLTECGDSAYVFTENDCYLRCVNCNNGVGYFKNGQLFFLSCGSGYELRDKQCVSVANRQIALFVGCGIVIAISLVAIIVTLVVISQKLRRYREKMER